MQTILFLCTGNYYRSRYAEEIFNHQAGRDGLAWHAFSRAVANHHRVRSATVELADSNLGEPLDFAWPVAVVDVAETKLSPAVGTAREHR